MKTFDFIQSAISHNLEDPHSKALGPDCLSPPLAIMTQFQGREEGDEGKFLFSASIRHIRTKSPSLDKDKPEYKVHRQCTCPD